MVNILLTMVDLLYGYYEWDFFLWDNHLEIMGFYIGKLT